MFKKLKALFFVDDGDSDKKDAPGKKGGTPESPAKDIVPEQNVSYNTNAGNPDPAVPSTGKVSTKFMDVLFGAMEKNNIEGYDYIEYKQSLKSLSKIGNMDEATRFKSAFAAAEPMGATKKKLTESAAFYLDILQQEDAKFAKALENQKAKQIGGREEHMNKMKQLIAQKEKQIEQLRKEIELNQKEMTKLEGEITNSTVKVEATKNNFVVSYNFIVSQIKRDIESINQHIEG